MSAPTTKVLGRFAYQADAIPKGGRSPRRVDLWAPAEFEIASIDAKDLAHDAIVVEPSQDHAGYERGRPLSLSAYAGALWSPMKSVHWVKAIAHALPISVEHYVAQSGRDYERTFESDDPILGAFDRAMSEAAHPLPDRETRREDDFEGKVLWSNRNDALARHVEAARDVLFVDDKVYVRRPEPTWTVFPRKHIGNLQFDNHVSLTGLVTENGQQRFRLDRCADAMEWAKRRHPKAATQVTGTVVRADFSLLRRNDLACMLRDCAQTALCGAVTEVLPFLSEQGLAAWRALVEASRSGPRRLFLDDRVESPSDYLAHLLSMLVADLSVPTLPANSGRARENALALIEPLQARADFETTRQPAFGAEEDEALGRLAAAP